MSFSHQASCHNTKEMSKKRADQRVLFHATSYQAKCKTNVKRKIGEERVGRTCREKVVVASD